MFRRFVCLLALIVILSVGLAACGDSPTATPAPAPTPTAAPAAAPAPSAQVQVPTYTGATVVNLSDSAKAKLQEKIQAQSATNKNLQITFYKTTDSVDQVKTGLTAAFTQSGWTDASAGAASSSTGASVTSSGGVPLAFSSTGSKVATVLIYPGTYFKDPANAISDDIKDTDTVITLTSWDQ